MQNRELRERSRRWKRRAIATSSFTIPPPSSTSTLNRSGRIQERTSPPPSFWDCRERGSSTRLSMLTWSVAPPPLPGAHSGLPGRPDHYQYRARLGGSGEDPSPRSSRQRSPARPRWAPDRLPHHDDGRHRARARPRATGHDRPRQPHPRRVDLGIGRLRRSHAGLCHGVRQHRASGSRRGSELRRAAEAFARCPARDLATGRLQRRAVDSGQTIFVPDCSREGAPGRRTGRASRSSPSIGPLRCWRSPLSCAPGSPPY